MAPSVKHKRPARLSAGRKSLPEGYVDTNQHVDSDGESSDSTYEERAGGKRRGSHLLAKSKRKRRRSKSPPLIPLPFDSLATSYDLAIPELDPDSDDEIAPDEQDDTSFTLKIPAAKIAQPITIKFKIQDSVNAQAAEKMKSSELQDSTAPTLGFLSLPAELRDKIYRLVFSTTVPIDMLSSSTLRRSGGFLRTCRTVYMEGSVVLYANQFHFRRDHRTRGELWESDWKEVGYSGLRRFLSMMRPETVKLIKSLDITFSDASRTLNSKAEDRYYWLDEDLIFVLKLLRKYAALQSLKLDFLRGHKRLEKNDASASRFLKHLSRVRVNELEVEGIPEYRHWYREQGGVSRSVIEHLKEKMKR